MSTSNDAYIAATFDRYTHKGAVHIFSHRFLAFDVKTKPDSALALCFDSISVVICQLSSKRLLN